MGTEHLLLRAHCRRQGVAARALQTLDISIDKVRAEIERVIGRGEAGVSGPSGFTRAPSASSRLAFDEARQLRHSYIGTEHILLGLIREGEG